MNARYLIDFTKKQIEYEFTDIAVIGAGIAGLFAGLEIGKSNEVVIIAKGILKESSTEEAQGGIAAAICEKDSTSLHKKDTVNAGHGLCSNKIVEEVVKEGPKVIESLLYYGVPFDRNEDQLSLTREGAHSANRVLHASGDGTGRVIRETLTDRVKEKSNIKLMENAFVIDIYTEDGEAKGVFLMRHGKVILLIAKYIILASGGAGQLYKHTTNPDVTTGDGIAMAFRAKANIRDLEFVQFHPTALTIKDEPRFLISEAVRGEGAVLRNHEKKAFMEQYHPQKELAPRDVVARAILDQMDRFSIESVYLDVSHMSEQHMKGRFPNIYKTCHKYGIKVPEALIPVTPAAHYIMGGITVDINGKTNISKLFACGEVTSSGLHGANRLASNSLLEALVFSKNIANYINRNIPIGKNKPKLDFKNSATFTGQIKAKEFKHKLQDIMWKYAGLKRNEKGLSKLIREIEAMLQMIKEPKDIKDYEVINMLQVSLLLAKSALERKESRGGHYRSDYPASNNKWKKHINFNIDDPMWCSEI